MPSLARSILSRIGRKYSLRFLSRLVENARRMSLLELRDTRVFARELRGKLDALTHIAESRLSLPAETAALPSVQGSDWTWRPDVWTARMPTPGFSPALPKTRMGEHTTVFHDCPQAQVTLRQTPCADRERQAPYGLCLDVLSFSGSYLSLVIRLPENALAGLGKKHVIRMQAQIRTETPLDVSARLNVKSGPNTEQLFSRFGSGSGACEAEFDLAYIDLNEKRVEALWVDLFFENPAMNQISLHDLMFSRRVRADL